MRKQKHETIDAGIAITIFVRGDLAAVLEGAVRTDSYKLYVDDADGTEQLLSAITSTFVGTLKPLSRIDPATSEVWFSYEKDGETFSGDGRLIWSPFSAEAELRANCELDHRKRYRHLPVVGPSSATRK